MFGFDFGGQTKIAYTQDPNLHALEVTDLESSKTAHHGLVLQWLQARVSAAHALHPGLGCPPHPRRERPVSGKQNLGVGERATEVLLPEVSFEALKELFLGNDFTRTRPYRRAARALRLCGGRAQGRARPSCRASTSR